MKKYIIPFLALGLATACVDDEGNYNYTDMNQLSVENIEASYDLLAYIDVLEINPTIEGSLYGDDESNYEYKWVLCYQNHTHDIIGTERDLKWKADVPEGEYKVYLYVTDKNTDIEKNFNTTIRTASPFNTGFLVLGKDMSSGLSALDMVTMPPNRDTTMVENVVDMSSMNMTEPSMVITAGRRYPNRTDYTRIWISGEDNSYCILSPESESVSTLSNLGDAASQAFIEIDIPHDKRVIIRDMFPRPSYTMRNNWYRGYITNDLIVFGMRTSNEYYAQPCNRYSAASEVLFKPYPLCFCPGTSSSAQYLCMAYDMDADCFVNLPGAPVSGTFVTKPTDRTTDAWAFDLKSENRTLVYGENGFEPGNSYMYALVKEANSDSGIRYIYRWTLTRSWMGDGTVTATKSPLYTVDPAEATDFDKASHYMFSSNKTSVLYTVGNRLYQYDYSRRMLGHYDFPDEITLIKADYASGMSVSDFIVATYSEQNKGMIYKMQVPNNPNAVEFEFEERTDPETGEMVPVKWPTRLKVTDIEWKTN